MCTNNLAFLNGPATEVAPLLLGCVLERQIKGRIIRVRIVETEAYDQSDIASHSHKGQTLRNKIMFGNPGHLYVYFTYGMHYCCNIVVDAKGHGAAVLIRAVEPIEGEKYMTIQRPGYAGKDLCNGPAKLCQALGIDRELNGHELPQPPLKLIVEPPMPNEIVTQTTRIGISKGKELLWRFYILHNPYVSKQ